jgi:hypothetical protein
MITGTTVGTHAAAREEEEVATRVTTLVTVRGFGLFAVRIARDGEAVIRYRVRCR